MKLSSAIVGTEAGPIEQVIDARWLMAYSAALGETDPRYFDTAAPGGVLAHPLFAVCYEWPASMALRDHAALRPLYPRLVHATHDLTIHRAPRAGETLRCSARLVAVSQRRPGAYAVFRLETRDAAGEPVSKTDFGVLYRGVPVAGGERLPPEGLDPLTAIGASLSRVGEIAVPATLAHTYSECARIWNPIHTDVAHARAAGLPGTILHGTATLALSVSRVLAALDIDPARVRRIRCRFSGMVPMPSTLSVRAARVRAAREKEALRFETWCGGEAVLSRGLLLQ